jgi:hypothetical protein
MAESYRAGAAGSIRGFRPSAQGLTRDSRVRPRVPRSDPELPLPRKATRQPGIDRSAASDPIGSLPSASTAGPGNGMVEPMATRCQTWQHGVRPAIAGSDPGCLVRVRPAIAGSDPGCLGSDPGCLAQTPVVSPNAEPGIFRSLDRTCRRREAVPGLDGQVALAASATWRRALDWGPDSILPEGYPFSYADPIAIAHARGRGAFAARPDGGARRPG